MHKGASLPGILFLNRVVMLTLLLENNRNQNVVSTSFVSRHMIVRFAHLNVVPAMCTRSLYTGAWMLTKLYRNHAQKCAKLNNLFFFLLNWWNNIEASCSFFRWGKSRRTILKAWHRAQCKISLFQSLFVDFRCKGVCICAPWRGLWDFPRAAHIWASVSPLAHLGLK